MRCMSWIGRDRLLWHLELALAWLSGRQRPRKPQDPVTPSARDQGILHDSRPKNGPTFICSILGTLVRREWTVRAAGLGATNAGGHHPTIGDLFPVL